MSNTLNRCAACVLPDTTPNISFDANGRCSYCATYSTFRIEGEQAFLKNVNKHRSSRKKYECIVNISGGRDSAYTLLKIKKDYGMKVLAVNYENPFTDEQAKKNINNAVRILGVDLIRFKHASNVHESCFRHNLITWFKNPSPAMIPMMCIGCKIIWKQILHIAKIHDVSLIINGGNPYEYTSFKKELLYVSSSEGLSATYSKYLKGLISHALHNVSYLQPTYVPVLLKGYLFNNQYSLGSRIIGKDIERVDLFHYIQWNETEIINRIVKEIGWDYPHHLNTTWRFDCKIGHLKDYMYLTTLGITEKDDFYAKLVREKILSREQALARLEKENQIHMDIIMEVLDQIGLSDKSRFILLPRYGTSDRYMKHDITRHSQVCNST